ncbi:hypothetical protein D3C71_1643430 [compost metagenome]
MIEPVQGPLIAHGILIASGLQLAQDLVLVARVVALQLPAVEQRLQGRVVIPEYGADGLRGDAGRGHWGGSAGPCDQQVALEPQRDTPDVVSGLVR